MATLVAPDHASPIEDAQALRKAVKGLGTDERAVISIIGRRNATQRKLIREAYEEMYHEDLIKRLESELSGNFERAVYRWILDPLDREAVIANVAIRKAKPVDYRVIIEISCIHSSEELLAVKRAYMTRYKRSLEEDVAAHTSGDIRKLLVALVSTYRYDGDEINQKLANLEADLLHETIKEKMFNHEEIVRILSTRSKEQLVATFNRFRDEHGTTITKKLQGESGDDYLIALRTAIRCIIDPHKYYVKVLRNAINKAAMDGDALTRVIVTRAEKDLGEIKELYYKRSSVTLDHAVAKETSGDYKAFLLTLLGGEKH